MLGEDLREEEVEEGETAPTAEPSSSAAAGRQRDSQPDSRTHGLTKPGSGDHRLKFCLVKACQFKVQVCWLHTANIEAALLTV